ncbi:uncharacterized protein LOC119066491 [Bradysia coprophila]|uniref:uncharacterized protein LOC119066491 n=1 Tax=Bradysia coprophila TaxID=38358 RepID=UPI00187D8786|nr:uncharacterized protein LOC119066491 [Bradysia coprophila]XP_037024896.1 uncharacterized protein LOC119066491 [Bradysia coprophila]
MLFGKPLSLADEDAIMAEGLVFENSQNDLTNFEVLAEIELEQQQVPVLLTGESSGSQEQALGIDARTPSMLGPLDIDACASSILSPHNEALRDRATLSIDEQLSYVEIPSSEKGLCPLGSETFRVPSSTAAHNANVERGSSSSVYVRSANSQHSSASSTQNTESSSQAGTSNTRYRLIGSTQPVAPKPTPHRNDPTANRKIPNSALSKNSPVVQATVAVRQQEKNSSSDATSMEKIKEKMELYLNACNDKLVKKPERSPHASFLSYLGSKMDGIPKEKIPALEKEILDIVYRFSSEA